MSSTYLEYAPSPRLRSHVACYWSLTASENTSESEQRVLPDGCVDLIFDNFSGDSGAIVGTMTRAVSVSLDSNAQFFGIRFRPGGAHPFLKFSIREITDAKANLSEVWRTAERTHLSVIQSGEANKQIAAANEFLEKRLSFIAPLNLKVQAAVAGISARRGDCSIETLSQTLEISRQHLNRLFTETIGLNIKMFARVVRLQAVLKRARRSPVKDWAAFALENGFYDQAHFIADFKDLTDCTPTQFFKREI